MSQSLFGSGRFRGAAALGALATLAFSSMAGSYADPPTPESCWEDFKSSLEQCSSLADPISRASCFSVIVDLLGHCLDGVDEELKPEDCLGDFLEKIIECEDNDLCNTSECQEACAAGAEVFTNWCAAVSNNIDAELASPEWHGDPGSIDVWDLNYELTVVTKESSVDAVRFWVVHRSGIGADTTSKAYSIGSSELTGEFGDRRVWKHNGHRAAWEGIDELLPFGPHERVVIVAQAERKGETVGVSHVVAQIK